MHNVHLCIKLDINKALSKELSETALRLFNRLKRYNFSRKSMLPVLMTIFSTATQTLWYQPLF